MKKLALVFLLLIVVAFLMGLFVPLDPDERRPGLNLSGKLVQEPNTNWSFLSGRTKIYVQMSTWYQLPHSITTTSWVHDGDLYVPCGRCATKNWPNHVARNNLVRLKVQGKLYDKKAVRLTNEQELRSVMSIPAHKPTPEGVWVYRMDSRG